MRFLRSLLLLSFAGLAAAQSPQISGSVVDPSGAPVQGIVVAIGGSEVVTDATGGFRTLGLKPGHYVVKVGRAPFRPVSIPIELTSAIRPLRIVLKLAEVRNEVNVTESAEAVSTAPADNLSAVTVSSEELRGLPILGTNYMSVLQEMVGGAGEDEDGVTIVVDGVEMDAKSVPIEAIQQVKINRDPYTAEFTRPGRGRIEITTRDASTAFHGAIRAGLRDSAVDARNAFANARPDENRQLFTGYLSGPLDRSGRTSFMVAAEQENENLQSVVYAQTPSGLLNQQIRTPQSATDLMVKIRRLVGERHVFTVRFDRERESAENQGTGGFRLPEAGFRERSNESEFRAQHSAFLSANLVSDLSFQWESSRRRSASVSQGRLISVADAFVGGGAQVDTRSDETELGLKYVLSWSKGKHLVRGGMDVPDWTRQTYEDFGNRQGTVQFASLDDFRAGRPFAFTQQVGDGRVSFRQRTVGLFIQDTINLRPGLTAGLGLRYDRQNFISDTNNLAPRLSLAWSPGQRQKTVIRGGSGIFYTRLNGGVIRDALLFGRGDFRRLIVSNPLWPDPSFEGGGAALPPALVRMADDLRSPYTIHYSLGVEHRLSARTTVSATWRGFRGVSAFRSRDVNAPWLADGQRPDPALGIVRQFESSGTVKSQSLELGVSGRLSRFFNGSIRYELGRVMSHADGRDALPPNSYNLESEWSRSNRDRRQRLRALGTVPVGKWFKAGFVLFAATGNPYSLITGQDNNQDGIASDRPAGVPRNSLQGPGVMRLDVRMAREFRIPALGGRGPTMEATVDAFNVFNGVNYAGYVGNLSSPFYGLPVSAQPARRLQFGLRLTF